MDKFNFNEILWLENTEKGLKYLIKSEIISPTDISIFQLLTKIWIIKSFKVLWTLEDGNFFGFIRYTSKIFKVWSS